MVLRNYGSLIMAQIPTAQANPGEAMGPVLDYRSRVSVRTKPVTKLVSQCM